MSYFDLTPLAANQHLDNEAEVREVIRQYMEGSPDASLDKVTVIEVPGLQNVENGAERDPSDFWPPL